MIRAINAEIREMEEVIVSVRCFSITLPSLHRSVRSILGFKKIYMHLNVLLVKVSMVI